MSIARDILQKLWESELNYKGVRVNILGIPKFLIKKRSVSNSLSKLKKAGFVEYNVDGWSITKNGETYYKEKLKQLPHFTSPYSKHSPKNLIVMFDVPENKRVYRDWLRSELKIFGYVIIQHSVWVGPSPLPKEFTRFIKEIGLNSCIKTFKLNNGYKK